MTTDEPAPTTPRGDPSRTRPRRRGLFACAMIIFAVGIVATVAAIIVPLVSASGEGPTWVYLVAMICAPLGFLLAIVYAILSGRPPKSVRR